MTRKEEVRKQINEGKRMIGFVKDYENKRIAIVFVISRSGYVVSKHTLTFNEEGIKTDSNKEEVKIPINEFLESTISEYNDYELHD